MNALLLYTLLSSISYNVDLSEAPLLAITPDKLLKAPVVVTVINFTTDSAEQFAEDIQKAVASGEPIIPIVINSYGGSIYALLQMVDIIESLKVPVATIAIGKAMSAGAILLAMGSEGLRYASPNSTILVHDASTMVEGKLSDIKVETNELERLNKLIFALMAKRCRRSPEFFSDLLKSKGHIDWYLTPQEAKEYCIVDHVKLPTITIKVKTEMGFE